MEDAVDQRIVREVSLNARATLAELSAAVGLSVSAVQTRLRRLEARGVITGYRATVDAEAVGKPLSAFIVTDHAPPTRKSTSQRLSAMPVGPHQRTRCTGSAHSRNRSAGGASK